MIPPGSEASRRCLRAIGAISRARESADPAHAIREAQEHLDRVLLELRGVEGTAPKPKPEAL